MPAYTALVCIEQSHYNTDLDITRSRCGSQNFTMEFYKGIIEMTIVWSFSYDFFVKLSLYNTIHL